MMRFIAFPVALALALTILSGCSSTPPRKHREVAEVATALTRCSSSSASKPEGCDRQWSASSMAFAAEVTRQVYGDVDPQLQQGLVQPPGSAALAWDAMIHSGRSRLSLGAMPEGAAVFLDSKQFPAGVLAIYSGRRDEAGDPLVVTSAIGGNGQVRLISLSKLLLETKSEILGWAEL